MSNYIKILPNYLIKRYKTWKATVYEENKNWYRKIVSEGQNPRAMVISCCDARIHVTSMFGADSGEFFIHRNIANLVPPYNLMVTTMAHLLLWNMQLKNYMFLI